MQKAQNKPLRKRKEKHPHLKYLLYKILRLNCVTTIINIAKRQTDQWNKIESTGIVPDIYQKLIFSNCAKSVQRGK